MNYDGEEEPEDQRTGRPSIGEAQEGGFATCDLGPF